MAKLTAAFRRVATAPKMLRRYYKTAALQMIPSHFTVVYIFMNYVSTTYYHFFPIFPEFHVTAKSFLGHKCAVYFSFSDNQLHVQLASCSSGNI
jgi:hypothetical protein